MTSLLHLARFSVGIFSGKVPLEILKGNWDFNFLIEEVFRENVYFSKTEVIDFTSFLGANLTAENIEFHGLISLLPSSHFPYLVKVSRKKKEPPVNYFIELLVGKKERNFFLKDQIELVPKNVRTDLVTSFSSVVLAHWVEDLLEDVERVALDPARFVLYRCARESMSEEINKILLSLPSDIRSKVKDLAFILTESNIWRYFNLHDFPADREKVAFEREIIKIVGETKKRQRRS